MNKKSKFARYGGIIFVLIFVLVTFAMNMGLFYPKYESVLNTVNFPVVYSKDNTLCIAPLGKKANALSDFLTAGEGVLPVVSIADSGNAVCFFENYDDKTQTGSLFVTYDGKEKIPVSGKAYKTVYMTQDGAMLLYAENADLNTGSGKLVLWKKNGKKEEISTKVKLKGFGMDKEKGHIFYIEYADGSDSGDLYVKKGAAEKIDSDVFAITHIPDGNSVMYTKHTGEYDYALYYWKTSQEAQKIDDAMLDFKASGISTESFVWCSRGGELSVYNKGKINALDTAASNILRSDPTRGSVLYTKNFSPETYEYDVNLIYKGGETEKVASSEGNMLGVATSVDFKTTAYIENNNLYIKEKGWRAEKEPVLVAENVSSFELSLNGKALAYVSDGVLYLKFGSAVGMVSENVAAYRFTPNGGGLCYLANYNETKRSGNLFIRNAAKPQSESVKIDSDVMYAFHARNEKTVVYIRNYNNETGEGELCVSRNGKVSKIDTGKIKILCEKY